MKLNLDIADGCTTLGFLIKFKYRTLLNLIAMENIIYIYIYIRYDNIKLIGHNACKLERRDGNLVRERKYSYNAIKLNSNKYDCIG